ncbi:MAG: hypothetical protein IJ269_04770 [Bacteroidales bacterium]|nr:hypothetical protein [Bacteroidales bacterium]
MSWKNKANGKPIALVVITITLMTVWGCCCKSNYKGNCYPLMSGDLLFQVNKSSELVDAITNSTIGFENLSCSNVGILIEENEELYIIAASTINGVEIMQLQTFLDKSAATQDNKPIVIAKRLKDTSFVQNAVERAKTLIGRPFDFAFLPNNNAIYGSELVYESYLDDNNNPLFASHQMFFRDSTGNTSDKWISYFKSYNLDVPVGEYGTNPNDMANDTILEEIYRFF